MIWVISFVKVLSLASLDNIERSFELMINIYIYFWIYFFEECWVLEKIWKGGMTRLGVWKLICLRTSKDLVWGNLIELNIPIYFCNKFLFLCIIGKINIWFNSYFIFLVGNPAIVEKETKIGILKSKKLKLKVKSANWAIFSTGNRT